MITRIEIDGFKSLRDFAMDLEPFTVLVGPNSAGKSNVLEALMLLSRLASMSIAEAFKGGRGRVLDQFTRQGGEPGRTMRFGLEILTSTNDTYGVAQTRFRYELMIERRTRGSGVEQLAVTSEALRAIEKAGDAWTTSHPSLSPEAKHDLGGATLVSQVLEGPNLRWVAPSLMRANSVEVPITPSLTALASLGGIHSSEHQVEELELRPESLEELRALANQAPSLTPDQLAEELTKLIFHQEGRAMALARERVAAARPPDKGEAASHESDNAEAGSLPSPTQQAPDPFELVAAVAKEVRAMRVFQLDAVSLRHPSERVTQGGLAPDASNLPTVLAELPPQALGALRADLVSLVPGLSSFDVVPEDESFRIDFEFSGGERLPARVVSDGTLRLLAMLTALQADPAPSVLGIEEPENGIYPGRLRALLKLLQELSLRTEEDAEGVRAGAPHSPPRPQVILTTHSPVMLAAMHMHPECLRFLNVVRRDGRLATHVRKVARSVKPAQAREFVSLREIDRILDSAKADVAEAGE
jgi:predicted ATPase